MTQSNEETQPKPDPGNSSPEEWTKEASEEELAEVQKRLEEEWGA